MLTIVNPESQNAPGAATNAFANAVDDGNGVVGITIDDATLASIYVRPANPERGMSEARRSRAECIAHALEHTAVHLGHLQLQRQLWDAEQAA